MVAVVVVDNSVLVSLFLKDEPSETMDYALDLAETGEARLLSPGLCLAELGNSLLSAMKRKRLSAAEVIEAYQESARLPIQFVESINLHTSPKILELATCHGLTFYDAVYLALAVESGATLATADTELRRAAKSEGVALLKP